MTGNELRRIIEIRGVSIASTAFSMGVTPMALQSTLKSPDIKSGHLEAAARALGLTIQEMYACLSEDGQSEYANNQQEEPSVEGSTCTNLSSDMSNVLLHLVSLVTEQNKKIDDLTNQVADLKAAISTNRNSLRHVLPCNDGVNVSET